MRTPALVCLAMLASAVAATPAEKICALILTRETDMPWHDWRSTPPFLRGALANTGRFDVKVECGTEWAATGAVRAVSEKAPARSKEKQMSVNPGVKR